MTLQTCDKIFIPIDLSPASALAVREGMLLAQRLGAELLLHHVIHDASDKPGFYHKKKGGRKGVRPLRDAAREMVQEFIWNHDLAREGKEKGVKFTLSLSSGLPTERIVEEATKAGAGLIVMVSQPKHGLAGWLEGSVARRVVKLAPMPVLVLKPEERS